MMEAIIEKRNKIVEFFLNKNILITRDILNKINSEEHIEEFYDDLFNKKQEIVIDEFENQQQTTIQQEQEDQKDSIQKTYSQKKEYSQKEEQEE